MAPSESRHTASRAPESTRDDPFAELAPGPLSAPLLHPQRQRELIEQAAGMSTRQVASLLAAAAPEVLPPRDTLRAVAPDRYTLKVSIDQECEQGLRRLKDLMSHLDPRMSWGDLVARVVREAVTRLDPRGGGSGQRRRRSAGSAGASPRRAPKETRAAGPAQRADESSGRAPNRTRAAVAPVAPARRTGGATPAPPGDTAATERQTPIRVLASAAAPSQSGPAAPLDGACAGGVPSGAPVATSARKSAPAALLDGARAGCARSGAPAAATPAATAAPKFASGALANGSHADGGVPGSPVATSAPQRALGVSPDGGPSGASAGAAAHTTREPVHSRHQSPPRRHIPAAVRRHIWQRDGAGGPAGIHFAAPRAELPSSLLPHPTLAGRCRCAHARRCRGLPSTISCRFRRSHPMGDIGDADVAHAVGPASAPCPRSTGRRVPLGRRPHLLRRPALLQAVGMNHLP